MRTRWRQMRRGMAADFRCAIIGLAIVASLLCGAVASADETEDAPEVATALAGLTQADFQKLVERSLKSTVVVTFSGRDGKPMGIGSGFVLSSDGLIATNLHVIGEARPISVRLFDGREFDVREIHATEKSQDLAILRIDADDLPPLELAEADSLEVGQPIFALGNPQGLEYSVVTGVVSGLRENVEGLDLIQLAIPIERGNSGGPLLDMQGRVHGLLTLKSQVTENLGYAVRASFLEPLLENPNPVAMSRWLTIGALDERLWEAPDDVRWTQRAGRIRVEGVGRGFGGRSLCLSRRDVPEVPYEVGVSVRMNEDDGAAGLVVHADGGDLHYGFYPSSGQLRFSRFDGPTVYDWRVLEEKRTSAYRQGDWNWLKVRVEEDRILCYCNEQLVFESRDRRYASGRVGLAKFRHTTAEFKNFSIAKELRSREPSDAARERVRALVETLPLDRPPTDSTIRDLADMQPVDRLSLEEQAQRLERQAERLRELSAALHARDVRAKIVEALDDSEGPADLLRAALLLASLDNAELDIDPYLESIDRLAGEFREGLEEDVSADDRLVAFHRFLFEDLGFHGSRTNYYDASNSYLNEVIDDREGLPISLSVLYIELARRVGIETEGIGLPGHFIVRVKLDEGTSKLVDAFERGEILTEDDCRERVESITGRPWREEYLAAQTPTDIILRMLRNLTRVANDALDAETALRYTETVLALDPESAEDHMFKAVLCYNTKRADEGLDEVDWILEREPEGLAIGRVRQLREAFLEMAGQTTAAEE